MNDTAVSVTSQIELIKKFILGKAFRGEIWTNSLGEVCVDNLLKISWLKF